MSCRRVLQLDLSRPRLRQLPAAAWSWRSRRSRRMIVAITSFAGRRRRGCGGLRGAGGRRGGGGRGGRGGRGGGGVVGGEAAAGGRRRDAGGGIESRRRDERDDVSAEVRGAGLGADSAAGR